MTMLSNNKGLLIGLVAGASLASAAFVAIAPRERPTVQSTAAAATAAPLTHDMAGQDMANMPGMDHQGHDMAPVASGASSLVGNQDHQVPLLSPSVRLASSPTAGAPGAHAGQTHPSDKIAGGEHAGHNMAGMPSALPSGLPPGTVHLTPQKQQLIGVRTAAVEYRTLERTIRATGKVEVDERRIGHVHTKIEGWIEQLYVNYTGKYVAHGQPLLTIYSPDLVSAQEEYLLALRLESQMRAGRLLAPGTDLRAAARRRLALWDMSAGEIAALERRGKPRRAVTLYAHAGGVVLEKKALAGMRVMPGDDLFTIADLSRVWVHAQVYENELPVVRVGQAADVTLTAQAGKTYRGRVVYVYPTLDPETRTARVRVELANPGGQIKPEMYASVQIKAPVSRHLTIPAEAALDSGERQVAFVVRPGGYFEPRPIKLGGRLGDRVIVTAGLAPGQRVVDGANFLIDSESQLQTAMRGMSGHQH